MTELMASTRSAMPYTLLPNAFIDHYMPSPNPVYALVYIVFYRHCAAGDKTVSVKSVAERLNILESDTVNALKYWHEQGIIRFKREGEALDIEFLPVLEPLESAGEPEPPEDGDEPPHKGGQVVPLLGGLAPGLAPELLSEERPAYAPELPSEERPAYAPELPSEERPAYAPEELEVYREANADIKRMFETAEAALSKLLAHSDMCALFGLYDWLRMPVPLIEYLLTYCAENGHRNLRYIEKCALDWAERGIKTVEDAQAYIQAYNQDFREILKAFGHTGRGPSASETAYMNKWLREYAMPLEVITQACDKTILQIGRPRFSYADKILTGWHNLGISTLEDVLAGEERFRAEKDAKPPKPNPKPAVKPNRFANFKQREWDYAAIEELERQYLMNGK